MGDCADDELQRRHGLLADWRRKEQPKRRCPICQKSLKFNGVGNHMWSVHGCTELQWKSQVEYFGFEKAKKRRLNEKDYR